MLNVVNDTSDRLVDDPAANPFFAEAGPALRAFIAERSRADGAIALLMRAAGLTGSRAQSVREAIATLDPDHRWLADLAALILSSGTTTIAEAVDTCVDLVRRSPGGGRCYPPFGALAFVAQSGDAAALDRVSDALGKAIAQSAAIGLRLKRKGVSFTEGQIAGVLLRTGLQTGFGGGALAAALAIVERHGRPEIVDEVVDAVFLSLPPGDERRLTALAFVERRSGRRVAARRAARLATKDGCGAAGLFAARSALAGGDVGATRRLLSYVKQPTAAIAREVALIELGIKLRIATDRLRFATTAGRKAAAAALVKQLGEAVEALPTADWWPTALVLLDHAIEAADLDAFDRLTAIGVTGHALARQMADHLLGADTSDGSGSYPEDDAIAARLLETAHRHREHGRTEAALIHFRLAREIASVGAALRLDFAYAALSLGRFDEALATAEPLGRIYSGEIGAMPWPADRDSRPWPSAPMPVAPPLPPGATKWPRISVVVPSFNQVKYVRDCLQSLVMQNYPDLEIIVFDAVSTDGTVAILEEYRDQVASLIVEPDKGQSDAINKGLSRATGDLLHWLNTDDMLAPGACHAIALAWLKTKADIISGACIEFTDHEMRLLNIPSAESEEFRVEELCRQFDRWLQGHFFYQPELFFSRRIWELTGGRLDPTHHLAMDFDLWLRAARAGARYERIHWPIAFFRKHAEQKTSQLEDTIDEQAEIIAMAVPQVPTPERAAEIERRLAVSRARPGRRRVAVVTKRYGKIFSDEVAGDLERDLADLGSVSLFDDPAALDPKAFDSIIHLAHVQADYLDIEGYRQRGFEGAVSAWFWDNHHTYFENRKTAEATDIIVPGHAFCATYLANPRAQLAAPVPLCVTQWGRQEARELFARYGNGPRRDSLSGGFVDYAASTRRSRLAIELIEAGVSDALLVIRESDLSPYFGMSRAERFENWCSFKTSLCLPLRRDLSQRFFDAWLTGQVVVVPEEIVDLFALVPADIRARHMVTFRKWTPEAVAAAQAEALALFDRGGSDGIAERHELAVGNHMMADRIRTILERY